LKLSLARFRDFLLFLVKTIVTRVEFPFQCLFDLVARPLLGRVSGIGYMPAALAVTGELVLPLRTVGDLATDAGVWDWFTTTMAAGTESNVAPMCSYLCSASTVTQTLFSS
jgi:hypothetical protein